ncbi:thioredoxin domain-containing protein [Aeoliella sp. ICT_H6.2]|uniref:Thioredoxin domain-containing protein n=1 Tax=Aeoliella straminimaris TaxID=2954799 RepID=A0A9X2JGD8_9BACT|nr:vitamin K epoxide reductase family protein [Aeoliella straminimaris]MCO6043423.1 thioredoxin domain-containing protein [Aeoliella straminimaris]
MSNVAKILATLITLAALVAVGASAYLVFESFNGPDVASCGVEGFDCESVLTSSWSKWLGVPVALLGGVVYLAIALVAWPAALSPRGMAMNLLGALSLMAVGAGIWFVGLQLFEIQSFCLFCMTAHSCGLAIACMTVGLYLSTRNQYRDARSTVVSGGGSIPGIVASHNESSTPLHTAASLLVGAMGVAALVLGQIVLPTDTSQAMQEVALQPAPNVDSTDDSDDSGEAPDFMENAPRDKQPTSSQPDEPAHRLLGFAALPRPIDADVEPMLGQSDATYVIVEMMDYTCPHCRQLRPRIEAARERYGDQFAIIVRPVALSSECNDNMPAGRRGRKSACDYAQLAMAVWQFAPDKFAEYHNWLLEGNHPPPLGRARQRAISLAGERVVLDTKLKSKISDRLRKHGAEWAALKTGLPLLLFSDSAVTGGGKSNEELFKTLESKLGIQPANP